MLSNNERESVQNADRVERSAKTSKYLFVYETFELHYDHYLHEISSDDRWIQRTIYF